jgi:hypothetical protein
MPGGVDFFGFGERSMVQPENNVAVVAIISEVRVGNRNGFVGVRGENCQGASCVEADSLDACRRDSRSGETRPNARCDSPPYVSGRLFLSLYIPLVSRIER